MKAPPPGLAALAPAHKHAAPQPCRARGAGGLTPGAARSHCWGGKWSSLVAAASCGAKRGRMVWIDLFAVRQFPGNEADLDFRAVVRRSCAVVVAAAPVPGIVSAKRLTVEEERREYRASPEYSEATKTLAFCRLWCIVELYAGLEARLPIIFRCCAARFHVSVGCYITITSGDEAVNMLCNFSYMVDVATAECAVPADKERELRTIGEENFAAMNRTVAGSMNAGARATHEAVWEVDAFNCGEPEALQRLPSTRVSDALTAAGSAGQRASVLFLLNERASELGVELLSVLCNVLTAAAQNGHAAVVQLLLAAEGVDVNQVDQNNSNFPLLLAAQNGHASVVQLLLAAEGVAVNQVHPSTGSCPLVMAAQLGHAAVVRLLLAAEGVDVNQVNPRSGNFPLLIAVQFGHEAVVQLLLAAEGVAVNQVHPIDGIFPLLLAAQIGHAAVVELLLAAAAVDVNQVDPIEGEFPLLLAAQYGHEAVVQLLLAAEGVAVNQVNPNDGASPLLMAVRQGNAKVVRLLLARGADTHVTWSGKSLLEVALDADHADVVEVFCAHL